MAIDISVIEFRKMARIGDVGFPLVGHLRKLLVPVSIFLFKLLNALGFVYLSKSKQVFYMCTFSYLAVSYLSIRFRASMTAVAKLS
jgi:hypothetical protein